MKHFLFAMILMLVSIAAGAKTSQNHIYVKAGDAESLLNAIEQANLTNQAENSPRLTIILPEGTYDLGERVLTTVKGHNVSIVGKGMEKTVIVNAPDIKNEGISKTATLLNRSSGLYLQDLTLKNALKYYESGFAGRAVCLQDKGTRTICKRVSMLSFQDTYYSDNEDGQFYFEDCEIHGTVDFICGSGDVYFNRCTLVTERRSADGSGRCVIAAPRTSRTPWGYVFESCTVRNNVSSFLYARAWKATPHCIWLRTTLEDPGKLGETRFDSHGMGTCQADFLEYQTCDSKGQNVTPTSNVITFTLNDDSYQQETILTSQQARRYQLKTIFAGWRPEKIVRKLEKAYR
jgi:pectin methylesterase-like acyl-CoA thioesterase